MNANQQIKKLIEALGITPNAFASKLGIKATSVYNILNDRNKPSYDLLEKVITTFHVNPNWILQGRGDIFYNISGNPVVEERKKAIKRAIEHINPFSKFVPKDYDPNEDKEFIKEMQDSLELQLRIRKASKSNKLTDKYSDLDGDLYMIHTYTSHYNVSQNILYSLDEYRRNKIEWDEVMTEFKKKLAATKELYEVIQPYENVIREIYEKVSDFNDKHDRLYCLDDADDNTEA